MTTVPWRKEGKKQSSTSQSKQSSVKRQGSEPYHPERIHDHSDPNPNHSLLQLQQTHGNQAVQQLVKERIQPKLEAGQRSDRYEHEADRVANQMMHMPNSDLPSQTNEKKLPQTQSLMQGWISGGKGVIPEVLPIVHDVVRSIGRPLAPSTRTSMESHFGYDFSRVRVHTDTKAAEAAEMLHAKAFTLGQDVYFGPRRYSPETAVGRRLLAHELTHVVEQSNGRNTHIQRKPLDGTDEKGFDPSRTNYRFDTYRITKNDLDDPEILTRLEALSLVQLIRYRDRVGDFRVMEHIDRLLSVQLDALTLNPIFERIAGDWDPIVVDYIDQWLATNVTTSFEIAEGRDRPDQAPIRMKIHGISINILPDEWVDATTFDKIKKGEHTDALTEFRLRWSKITWKSSSDKPNDRVTKVNPPKLKLNLKTIYREGVSRTARSGYGIGTRKEQDIPSGRRTLAHHEGGHVQSIIEFIRENPPPEFEGEIGDTVKQIKAKASRFQKEMEEYRKSIDQYTTLTVDCVGKPASFCILPKNMNP